MTTTSTLNMDLFLQAKKALQTALKADDYCLTIPNNASMGDISSTIAFTLKGNPKENAEKIAKKIKSTSLIKEVKAIGPYINFFFDKDKIANKIVTDSLKKTIKTTAKKNIISLDIYGPNALKGIHVGHIRNASLGACLSRILDAAGYKVITNSFGCDIGLPAAKVIWGYMNLGLKPEGEKGEWLGMIYSIVNSEFNDKPKVREEVYDINKRLYENDERLMVIYNTLIGWSKDYVKKVEKQLRLKIDKYLWESDTIKSANSAVELLKEKGIAKESDGAIAVDLKEYNLGVYVLLTRQGVPTYEAKDIGLQLMKEKLFKADKYILFTGAEQVMHFNQLFKTFELMGYKKGKMIHKPYEMVDIQGKKISSREGNVILFNQLIDELTNAALIEVTRKNPSLSFEDKKTIAGEIAISSLLYGMIKQDMNKKINFVISDWVRFDGDTGAYIQYNYVRARKILTMGGTPKENVVITDETEYALLKKINEFNKVIEESAEKFNPSAIAHYAYELSSAFSKFYEKCPVLKDEVNQSRLLIVKSFSETILKTMKIMGFTPLKEM